MYQEVTGSPTVARDLTAPWTFRGGDRPEDLWLRVTTGLASGPMPSFSDPLTPQQRWDVVNYVLSIARTAPWSPGGRLDGPGHHPDPARRGRYLVHAQICGLCHTPINRTGIYRADDWYLGGGMRVGAYPHGVFVSRNLTSDPETGLGGWTEEQVIDALRNGRARGRLLSLWDMPWMWYHHLRADDARAIARYLKELPAAENRIPAPLRYGVVETIAVKLARGLPVANPGRLTFADGIFGQPRPGLPRELPQWVLVGAQWFVLIGGVIAFVRARPAGRRFPRGRRGWLGAGVGVVALALIGLVGWALYALPAVRVIPPEQIAAGATAGVPQPAPARVSTPEQAILAERGRYLFTVECAICHLPDGAGGAKISWKPMGTLWTRNITPDPSTGIGRWTDAQVARAIRSGVSADGRALHWQGMVWDHASNLDEEDVRALIAFLRTLPPVRRPIPPPRPPAPDDCDVYTFWTTRSDVSGCR